jgi:hypothetical protein
MAEESREEWPPPTDRFVEPPPVPNVYRPGDKVTPGPLYRFKQLGRDDGKPYQSPEPMAERKLLALLGTNAAVVLMCGVLAAVVVTVVVLLVTRA